MELLVLNGGIVGMNVSNGVIKNVYSLENIYGINNATIEQSSVKTSEELKQFASTLGDSFKEDILNINDGYPILNWQY